MKKIFNILFFALISLCQSYQAQADYFFTRQGAVNINIASVVEEINTSNYLATVLTDSYVANNVFHPRKNQFYRINQHGALIDSILIDLGNNIISGGILKVGAYYYLGVIPMVTYSINNTITFFPSIWKYDANLNLVKKVILDSVVNSYPVVQSLILKNNKLFTGYYEYVNGASIKLYKLNLQLTKQDSAVIAGTVLSDINSYGNNLLISGVALFPQPQFANSSVQVMEVDTSFNIISQHNLDSLAHFNYGGYVTSIPPYSSIYPINKHKYIFIGQSPVPDSNSISPTGSLIKMVTSVIENNHQVTSTSFFGSNNYRHNFTTIGYKGSMRYNAIYSVAFAISKNTPSISQIIVKQPSYMLLQKTDTNGVTKWANYVGGDKYYFPTDIYATADSGALVYGLRYDSAAPKVVDVGEAFIMKIDKNGNQEFVGIINNGQLNISPIKCFPNPAQDKLYFDVPFAEEIDIRIIDVLANEVVKIKNYQNLSALTITELKPGAYFYTIKTKNNFYTGKFVRE